MGLALNVDLLLLLVTDQYSELADKVCLETNIIILLQILYYVFLNGPSLAFFGLFRSFSDFYLTLLYRRYLLVSFELVLLPDLLFLLNMAKWSRPIRQCARLVL